MNLKEKVSTIGDIAISVLVLAAIGLSAGLSAVVPLIFAFVLLAAMVRACS